jgi:DNA repair exonuclease SbcCD nuclease subunit
LLELCLEAHVELLVIAGDLYDDWRDYSTGLFFTAQMARLREAAVRVVWIRGNHDAASKLTRHLRLPDNVQELSYKHPSTLRRMNVLRLDTNATRSGRTANAKLTARGDMLAVEVSARGALALVL